MSTHPVRLLRENGPDCGFGQGGGVGEDVLHEVGG